jgi:hypothetical protein
MQKTSRPQTAGILSVISGAIGLLGSFVGLVRILVLSVNGTLADHNFVVFGHTIAHSIYVSIVLSIFISGIIALVGGICAIRRKIWGMALAGSIASMYLITVVGLVSVILTGLSHDEFELETKNTQTSS